MTVALKKRGCQMYTYRIHGLFAVLLFIFPKNTNHNSLNLLTFVRELADWRITKMVNLLSLSLEAELLTLNVI